MNRLFLIVCVVICLFSVQVFSQSIPSFPTVYYGTVVLDPAADCTEDSVSVYSQAHVQIGSGKIIHSQGECMYSLGIVTDSLNNDTLLEIVAHEYYEPTTIQFLVLESNNPTFTLTRNDNLPSSDTDDTGNTETDSSDSSSDTQQPQVSDSSQEPFVPWFGEPADPDPDHDADNNDETIEENTEADESLDTRSFIPLEHEKKQGDSAIEEGREQTETAHVESRTQTENGLDITDEVTDLSNEKNSESFELFGETLNRTTVIVGLVVFLVFAYGSGVAIALFVMK